MTKEERAEKKRLREIEEERKAKEFPGAIMSFNRPDEGCTQIRLDEGDGTWIVLRKHKSAKWCPHSVYPGYETISLHLGFHIPALVALIRALVVRYNAIAKDINSETSAIPRMESLALIPAEDPPEVIT